MPQQLTCVPDPQQKGSCKTAVANSSILFLLRCWVRVERFGAAAAAALLIGALLHSDVLRCGPTWNRDCTAR